MPAYEKQHYVPRLYLNYFATPESRQHPNKKRWQIYVHHKDTDETTSDPPIIPEAAYGPWYYELENDEEKFMENTLGDIETLAGEVIKKINQTGNISWLIPRDKKRLANFMAAQHVRVPKQRGLGYRSLAERDFAGYTLSERDAHTYAMMKFMPIVGTLIYSMEKWELLVNSTDVPLITSDSPVSTMALGAPTDRTNRKAWLYYLRAAMGLIDFERHDPNDYPMLGFNIPLSPTLLLVVQPKESTTIVEPLSTVEVVRLANANHVVQSYKQLYASTSDFGDLALVKEMSAMFHTQLQQLESEMPEE